MDHALGLGDHAALDRQHLGPADADEVDLEIAGAEHGVAGRDGHGREGQDLIGEGGDVATEQRAVAVEQLRRRRPRLADPTLAPVVQAAQLQGLHDRRQRRVAALDLVEPVGGPGQTATVVADISMICRKIGFI